MHKGTPILIAATIVVTTIGLAGVDIMRPDKTNISSTSSVEYKDVSATGQSLTTYRLPGAPKPSSDLIASINDDVTYSVQHSVFGGYEATPSHYLDNYLVTSIGCDGSLKTTHQTNDKSAIRNTCEGSK